MSDSNTIAAPSSNHPFFSGEFQHAPANRVSPLEQEKTAKCGVKNKRLTAGWDDDYIEKVVFAR